MVSEKKKCTMMTPIWRQMKKMHPFQWTERPIGALVVISSFLPAKDVASGTVIWEIST